MQYLLLHHDLHHVRHRVRLHRHRAPDSLEIKGPLICVKDALHRLQRLHRPPVPVPHPLPRRQPSRPLHDARSTRRPVRPRRPRPRRRALDEFERDVSERRRRPRSIDRAHRSIDRATAGPARSNDATTLRAMNE